MIVSKLNAEEWGRPAGEARIVWEFTHTVDSEITDKAKTVINKYKVLRRVIYRRRTGWKLKMSQTCVRV